MRIVRSANVLLVLLLLCPFAAQSAPITYSFNTGTSPFGNPTLAPLFSGMSVSGTFDYDAASPATLIVPSGIVAGSTVYSGSTMNLSGSIGANAFSDLVGAAVVGDDKFLGFTPATDFLQLSFQISGTGFDIAGFTLSAVRLFWIEGQLGITDFLSDQSLPSVLPDFQGRLALDFTSADGNASVFFNGLTVAQVPEPATLSLLALGLLALAYRRRMRLARNGFAICLSHSRTSPRSHQG